MDFYIDEQYLTSVTVREDYFSKLKEDASEEELANFLSKDRTKEYFSISSKDHPMFDALRTHLGSTGYIEIERGWWNGDRVTKPFTLNGVKFKVGDKFSCAAAMKGHLEIERKYAGVAQR